MFTMIEFCPKSNKDINEILKHCIRTLLLIIVWVPILIYQTKASNIKETIWSNISEWWYKVGIKIVKECTWVESQIVIRLHWKQI